LIASDRGNHFGSVILFSGSDSLFLAPWLGARTLGILKVALPKVMGDSPPCTIEVARGKRKVLTKKKRTRGEREAEEALAVARAADHAERGGRGSGILIGDSRTCVPLTDRVLSTEATEEAEDQPEE
jgi:hypothetical protein